MLTFEGGILALCDSKYSLPLEETLYSKFISPTNMHDKIVQNRRLLVSLHLGCISQKTLLSCVFLMVVEKPVTVMWATCHGDLWHGEPFKDPLAATLLTVMIWLVRNALCFLSHLFIHWIYMS